MCHVVRHAICFVWWWESSRMKQKLKNIHEIEHFNAKTWLGHLFSISQLNLTYIYFYIIEIMIYWLKQIFCCSSIKYVTLFHLFVPLFNHIDSLSNILLVCSFQVTVQVLCDFVPFIMIEWLLAHEMSKQSVKCRWI